MLHGSALVEHKTSGREHSEPRAAANTRSQPALAPHKHNPLSRVGAEVKPAVTPPVSPASPDAAAVAAPAAAPSRSMSAPQLVPYAPSTVRFEGLGHFRNDVLFVHVHHQSRALLQQIFGKSALHVLYIQRTSLANFSTSQHLYNFHILCNHETS